MPDEGNDAIIISNTIADSVRDIKKWFHQLVQALGQPRDHWDVSRVPATAARMAHLGVHYATVSRMLKQLELDDRE